MSRELVSTLIAAKRYGISEKSIRRYIAKGFITGYRVGDRRLSASTWSSVTRAC